MRSLRLFLSTAFLVLAGVVVASNAPAGDDVINPPAYESTSDDAWQFSVGFVYQWGAEMNVRGSSATLVRSIWSSLPGGSSQTILDQSLGFHPTADNVMIAADDITQYGDRIFDDGFVSRDVWTEDPGQTVARYGTTWNWGYDNASQYNAADLTLSYHRTTSVSGSGTSVDVTDSSENRSTKDVLRDDAVSAADEFSQDGIQFTARRRLRHWDHWDLRVDLNVAWFPQSSLEASDSPFDMQVRQDTYRVAEQQVTTYSYQATYQETYVYVDYFGKLDPTLPALPTVAPAPYAGAGYYGPTGPLIPDLPDSYSINTVSFASQETPVSTASSSTLVGTHYWDISDQVDVKADLEKLRLSCGLELVHSPTNRLQVSLDPKVTLNFVNASLKRYESVVATDLGSGNSTVIAESLSHGEKSDMIPGLMLALGVNYRLRDRWLVGVDVSHEWVLNTLNIDMESDTVSINLDNTELNVYLTRGF